MEKNRGIASEDLRRFLVAEVTIEEIIAIPRSMPKNKSPSPDGFTSEFFLASWEVVGG